MHGGGGCLILPLLLFSLHGMLLCDLWDTQILCYSCMARLLCDFALVVGTGSLYAVFTCCGVLCLLLWTASSLLWTLLHVVMYSAIHDGHSSQFVMTPF